MKIEFIKKLIELLENSNINEIEIKRFGTHLKIVKTRNQVITTSQEPFINLPVSNTKVIEKKEEVKEEKKEEVKEKKEYISIKSPMVGTFYRAPAPDAPPFVELGDVVKQGQTVCIIEAMKIMNEIKAEVSGKVVEIPVKNEQPVEFGQVLFLLEPLK
uniref:Biotin carboxyl carrier protein of acetyl-CoA carboxylase n=1 Tax=candidate division WOR-3 bacterium TaxID=2052148 RepID=A0A7C4U7S9_UNCW3